MTATDIDTETAATTTGRGRKLLLAVLVIAVAVAAAWFFLLREVPEAAADVEVEDGLIVGLDPLTTTTGEAARQHARVAMSLVLAEGITADVVTDRAPLLQDALLREVARMDGDELRSAAGSDQLRAELTAAAQGIWTEGEVRRVVLTELLVQ